MKAKLYFAWLGLQEEGFHGLPLFFLMSGIFLETKMLS